jgi:hypothetical protein
MNYFSITDIKKSCNPYFIWVAAFCYFTSACPYGRDSLKLREFSIVTDAIA